MYRSESHESDGMRPRPLLGMANVEKRPSLKRNQLEGERQRPAGKREPAVYETDEDEHYEPDYDPDRYEPSYDTSEAFSRRDKEGRRLAQVVESVRRGSGEVPSARRRWEEGKRWEEEERSEKRSEKESRESDKISSRDRSMERREHGEEESRAGQRAQREQLAMYQGARSRDDMPRHPVVVKQEVQAKEQRSRIQEVEAARPMKGQEQARDREQVREQGSRRDGLKAARGEATRGSVPGVTKTSEDIFRKCVEKKTPYRNIPIPMVEKRRLMRSLGTQQSVLSGSEDIQAGKGGGLENFQRRMTDIWAMVEPWAKPLKAIEGTFGSGVGSYFRLLRTLLYLNLVVVAIFLLFIILPTVIEGMPENSNTLHFKDFFLGTGYFEHTILFYGSFPSTTSNFPWSSFDIPKAYFSCTLVSYAIFIIFIMIEMVTAVRRSFIDSAEIEGKKFGPALFTSWEMTIEDNVSANQLKNKICMDLSKLLKKKREKVPVSKARVLLRILLSVAVLGVIVGIGTIFWCISTGSCFPQEIEIEIEVDEKTIEWVIPLTIILSIFLMPWLLSFLNKVEMYGQRHNLYLRLLQTWTLGAAALTTIRVAGIARDSANDDDDQLGCEETRLGQVMYRIIIFYFFMVILNFVADTILSRVSKEAPQFNISGATTDLIFCQMATCFGFYHSPLLPFITTIILIITFYLQRLSLKINFTNSKKTWTNSSTRTVYLIITFVSVLIPLFFFFFFSINEVSMCGPFSGRTPFSVTGYTTNVARTNVFYWILSKGVWGLITVSAFILFYYSLSSARATHRLGRTLLRELQGEVKELRVLQKAVAGVARDTANPF